MNNNRNSQKRLVRMNDAYYDIGTKNVSFMKFAWDLKNAGVKNWFFSLKLYDPTLIYVDPYKEDEDGNSLLTPDEVLRIQTECYRNQWYYLREIARIPSTGSGKHGIAYEANLGNMAQAFLFEMGIDNWMDLPRQCGKTQGTVQLFNYAYDYGTTRATFFHLNRDLPLAKENLRRFSEQRRLLPLPLQFKTTLDSEGHIIKGRDSSTMKEHPITKNTISIKSGPKSIDEAVKTGRGYSMSIFWSDETEFTNHIDIVISNSAPAYRTSADEADKANTTHARLFTSTPGDLDSAAGKSANKVLKKTVKFILKMYDMTKEELKLYVKNNKLDSNRIVYIEYQYFQLGKDEKWVEDQYAEIGDPITFKREVLLQRIHGSGNSPFDQTDLEYISSRKRTPIDDVILQDFYNLSIYERLNSQIPYLVGVDCATGTLGDSNAMTIIHPKTLRPVAEFNCDYIGEIKFADLIEELVINYIPRACVIIERNHVGDAVIEYLLTKSKISGNLYYDKSRDIVADRLSQLSTIELKLKARAEMKTYYGSYTEGENRKSMFSLLANRVKYNRDDFVGELLINDIMTLVRFPTGKIAASPGEHDDNIMSYLIAMYIAIYGNNLPRFGIYITDTSFSPDSNEPAPYTPDMQILRQVLPDDVADAVEQQYYGTSNNMKTINDVMYRNVQEEVTDMNINDVMDNPEMFRKTAIAYERESSLLASKGLINGNNVYKPGRTADNEYYEDITERQNLSLFDDINRL